ncbi:MAG: potassium channel family protein, partial [Ruminococcus sp.]|nr:potassium channel family protein [Ruminococcus sp.]
LMRALRVFRVFKAVRYSKSIALIRNALTRERQPLITVGVLAVAYILISALVMFNVEPDMFRNYLDAIYWATVSLTTMGYGDISPVTTLGRMMTVASSIFGVAIIALPSAIITVGFMEALGDIDPKKESESENK